MEEGRLDVVDDGTLFQTGNNTEIIIERPESVEPLSIIVWCVGGVLLITLLSLLGRIILAKRKYPFENLDENGELSPRRRNNVFRIRIDGPEYNGYHNRAGPSYLDPAPPPEYQPSTQTTAEPHTGNQSVIPSYTLTSGQHVYHVRMEDQRTYTGSNNTAITSGTNQNGGAISGQQCSVSSSPAQQQTQQATQQGTQQTVQQAMLQTTQARAQQTVQQSQITQQTVQTTAQQTIQNFTSAINRTPSVVPESAIASCSNLPDVTSGRSDTFSTVPETQVATCSRSSGGRVASLNGYLISPPPYQQVVSSNAPLASVIVARQQRTTPRRLDFSL